MAIADNLVSDDRHNVTTREIASFGRDPRRPVWAANDGGEASAPRMDARAAELHSETERSERGRHQIVCDRCGQAADVPFRPTPGRPVYCNDCFRARDRRRVAASA
jgi:CxxC-x17-CxxC domain-containing protein